MRLNGETKTLKDPVALSDFLTQEGVADKRIWVERNVDIVPLGEFAYVILRESDTLEIVAFVGGGWSEDNRYKEIRKLCIYKGE